MYKILTCDSKKELLFKIVQEESCNQQFDVNFLLDHLEISGSHLRDLTRRFFGLSPSELIEIVRIDNILKHFESEEHFVILSARYGFGCIKTFNRIFTKRVGMSASVARRKLKVSYSKEILIKEWREGIWRSATHISDLEITTIIDGDARRNCPTKLSDEIGVGECEVIL